MFKKILIVEGLDSVSLGLSTSLSSHFTAEIITAKNSEEALIKLKRAVFEETHYDLVISDLAFVDANDTLKNGEEFISATRKVTPGIKIMVYSAETKPYRIYTLFHKYKINAFIAKGRESINEIIDATKQIYNSEIIYISPKYVSFIEKKSNNDIEEYDVMLLKHLSLGKTQSEISTLFKDEGMQNSSTSSIEKRINKLRILLKANNTINLIAIAKDLGII
ncbi:MAG: DUF5932 domain-containing protein [Bacteroidota bacterium]